MNLASVSRQWRAVALCTPDLWTHLSLTVAPERRTDDGLTNWLPLLTLWLDRSQSLPLSYTLQFKSSQNRSERDMWAIVKVFRPLIDALLLQSQRWKNVGIHTPNVDSHPSLYLDIKGLNLPHLEFLALSGTVADDVELSLTSETAPHLTSVALPALSLQNSSLPWSQLTTLYIKDDNPSPFHIYSIVDVLSRCFHLQKLHIQTHIDFGKTIGLSFTIPPPLTLPYLSHLRLGVEMEMIMERLLPALDCPALTTLSFYGCPNATSSPSIATFVERHFPQYRSATLPLAPQRPEIETVEIGFEGLHRDPTLFIRFWRMFSPGVKRIGMHLDESNAMFLMMLYETCKVMWPRADGFGLRITTSGPALEEVVLSMEAGYMCLHPDILPKTLNHLTLLLDGDRCGYGPDGGAAIYDEDERSNGSGPFFPCAQLKRIHVRMIENDQAPSPINVLLVLDVVKETVRYILRDFVRRGLELSFERTDKCCLFA